MFVTRCRIYIIIIASHEETIDHMLKGIYISELFNEWKAVNEQTNKKKTTR